MKIQNRCTYLKYLKSVDLPPERCILEDDIYLFFLRQMSSNHFFFQNYCNEIIIPKPSCTYFKHFIFFKTMQICLQWIKPDFTNTITK